MQMPSDSACIPSSTGVAGLLGGEGGQARDVGQRPTVDQVKPRAFARQHVVDALVQYFPNSLPCHTRHQAHKSCAKI
jgi:hypothetical protein